MKNYISSLVLLLGYTVMINAQTFPNYLSDNGWVFRRSSPQNSANWENPGIIPNPIGMTDRISMSSSGLIFDSVEDGDFYDGAEYNMGAALCNTWVTDFDFDLEAVSSTEDFRTGHFLFMYTDGPGNTFRYNDNNMTSGFSTIYTDNDVIGVYFNNKTGHNDLNVSPFVKDNTTVHAWGSPSISIGDHSRAVGHKYKIRLERLDAVTGQLTVWRYDAQAPNGLKELGEICFDIPPTVKNLTHIQHMNGIHGSIDRSLTATINNLNVQNCTVLKDCCMPNQLLGPTLVCDSDGGDKYTYTVEGGGSNLTYNWNLDPSIRYDDNKNSITVRDWGRIEEPTEISVDIMCGCRNLGTLSIEVVVRPTLDPRFGLSAINGGSGTSTWNMEIVQLLSTPPPGALHTWELYKTTSIRDCEIEGSPVETQYYNTVPFVFNTDLNEYEPHVVIHTVSYADGSCPVEICEGLNSSRPGNGGVGYALSTKKKRRIFPNPSPGLININYEAQDYSRVQIIVKDALGRLVSKETAKSETKTIHISNEGVFFIEIWEGDVLEAIEKVIIAH